ncbi:MAG: hypothetical protein EOQ92_08440 [Mesorhizobium sp.]|nr:MAG: hypothetical protein EOQ92_08440 [Mesorhizobium sp.]RWK47061.1 MAG: hypothetical protein EOR47_23300 [Mesorhizobium sp.]RWK92756.1 MAG: hypothetical protein EOR53_26005 [Mesorhizobium sp.]TIP92439.1 MAG: hypothetical protein E5X60_25425 [Mesorhizobium sp.]TIQ30648.1 MAG: hypothetical protein E5X54_08530 [Mesorhizobium sp.]
MNSEIRVLSPFTTHQAPSTAHYSLLTTHYSLLTTHYSLFAIRYSLFDCCAPRWPSSIAGYMVWQ